MITNVVAVFELAKIHHPNTGIVIEGDADADLSGVTLEDGSTLVFTFTDVLAKKTELELAEPLRLLRLQRDRLISETDWWVLPDRTPTQAQLDYRQALRDLPSNSSPELDANGQLINVNWPEKPQ